MVLALLLAVGDLEKLGDVLLRHGANALFLDQQRQALVNSLQGVIYLCEMAVSRRLFPGQRLDAIRYRREFTGDTPAGGVNGLDLLAAGLLHEGAQGIYLVIRDGRVVDVVRPVRLRLHGAGGVRVVKGVGGK